MSTVHPILQALPGEQVVALSPGDPAHAASDWLRRPHLVPGRALSAGTLQARQQWLAGRVAQRGQAFTPGVVRGLEVNHALEPDGQGGDGQRLRLWVEAGQGLAASGEDVTLTRGLSCLLADLPVLAPEAWFSAEPAPAPDPAPAEPLPDMLVPGAPMPAAHVERLNSRQIGPLTLGQLLPVAGTRMPRIGVLVAQPVWIDVSDFDPSDPCDRCPCGPSTHSGGGADVGTDVGADTSADAASFEDWRIADGLRLVWYPWPEEWMALPASPLRLRNVLAHQIFNTEARLPVGTVLPWAAVGVPLALMALDPDAAAAQATTVAPWFSDRASVVRQGGRARESRLQLGIGGRLQADSRLPALWQARIEQLAEQLAELGDPAPPAAQLADPFSLLPPCGLLPRNALDWARFAAGQGLHSDFFLPLATLDAVPVPIEQLDAVLREAASQAPIDLNAPGRVRLLVPVPQASWEPRLLQRDVIDGEFSLTLARFELRRARELGARQGLRQELALLTRTLTGEPQAVAAFNDDPLAVDTESLAPWGPPPVGGGHRSALRSGAHQHYFDSASEVLTPAANEALSVWVLLDADHPPRSLMLQWHVQGGDWEHRAIWGEDLAPWGAPDSAGHRLMGPLPEAGRWLPLEVASPVVDLAGRVIDGMAFWLYDGRAAYGMCGTRSGNAAPKWFCNVLPQGARLLGDEPWDLLTQNDLWAPFEPARGVVPAIPPSVPAAAGVVNGGHLEPSGKGVHQHGIEAAPPLVLAANEDLYAWVYLDPNDPPRQVMLQWFAGNWEHRAYWGFDLVPWGTPDTPSRQRLGGLPLPGQWERLVVPHALVALDSATPITGIAFTLFDGSAAFAAAGAVVVGSTPTGTGSSTTTHAERPWFAAKPPEAARRFGTWVEIEARDLHAPTNTSRIGRVQAVADLLADPLLSVLSEQERAQLTVRGLGPFVDYLRSRIDRVDDITDHGFVRMQSDIYRVRNLMLGATDALRLAVSPALASIAKAETAVASQAQISSYVANLKLQRPAGSVAQPLRASFDPGTSALGFRPTATAALAAMSVNADLLRTGPAAATGDTGDAGADGATGATRAAAPAGASLGPAALGRTSLPGAALDRSVRPEAEMAAGISVATASTASLAGLSMAVPSFSAPRASLGITLGGGLISSGTKIGGLAQAVNQRVAVGAAASVAQVVTARSTFEPLYVANRVNPTDVLLSAPIIGKSPIRTTAIADRLRQSASREARDYALATRQESLRKLLELVDQFMAEDGGMLSGLFSGFAVHGLRNDPFLEGSTERQRSLVDFVRNRGLLGRMLDSPTHVQNQNVPEQDTTDEGTLFSETADVSDNTVALLRQLEGRIKRYRDVLTRCELALAALQDDRSDAAARLAAAGDRLAEARHDVGVARALIAEEQARIAAVNARRAQVLAEELRFLAFIRPREAAPALRPPLRKVDPALAEAPVPACLREHSDVPDELEEMLRVVREAPADWFSEAPRLLQRLDRHDLLLRTLQSAQQRTLLVAQRVNASASLTAGLGGLARAALPGLAGVIGQVIARQTPLLAGRVQAVNSIDLARAGGLSWQALHQQAQQVVSFGDIIDGDHGRGEVSRQAAEAYGRIAQVCACLHAEFCGVSASIRLDWAELMSQYDAPPMLRNAGNLPRWSEIDSTDRRQMQAYIDWLFAQVDAGRDEAQSLVSDLVRMCLLLASHAPVGRIVAGRMPRPVVGVRPGMRIPLTTLDAGDRLRVGMHAMVYRGSQLLARAAIEDVGGGEASARVLHTSATTVDLGTDVRVQFAPAQTVSAPLARTASLGLPRRSLGRPATLLR